MNAKIEREIKEILSTIHRYEQEEIGLKETLETIKIICEEK